MLKKILYISLALIVLFLIAGILISRKQTVKSAISVEVPSNFVFNILNDLSLTSRWNEFLINPDSASLQASSPLKGIGSKLEINKKEEKSDIVTISGVGQDSITYTLTEAGNNSGLNSIYRLKTIGEQTEISAEAEVFFSFPSNVFGFILKSAKKRKLNKSLKHLSDLTFERFREGKYRGYKIKEEIIDDRYFVMHRSEVAIENIQQYYTQNISALYQKILDGAITTSGMPCALYFKWDMSKNMTDMAAALPLKQEANLPGTASLIIPAGANLIIDYYGDSAKSAGAHDAMADFMADRKLLNDVPVIEEYMTDPTKEADPAKWLTRIYYLKAD
ncbi:MAG: hypothetical protein IPM42_18110 [Saprospiraceae bacterium]|nr:hypothetical protein [Saprospiraceae bacterium]